MLAIDSPCIDELREQGGLWQCEFTRGMCKNQLLAEAEGTGQVKAQQNQGQTPKHSDQKEAEQPPEIILQLGRRPGFPVPMADTERAFCFASVNEGALKS